jgi:signal transduction histidine kinase
MTQDVAESQTPATQPDLQISMSDVVRFIRQLSHDLRNHLNAAELQSAFIAEIATDAEVKDEIRRLRAMLSDMGSSLQKLSGQVTPVRLTEIPYEAAAFVEDLRTKFTRQSPEQAAQIEWRIDVTDACLNIDPQQMELAVLELIANAFQHTRGDGPLQIAAEVRDGNFTIEIREPKSVFDRSTENWGREPFRNMKHGHYSLGLQRVRAIVEGHRGQLQAHFDRAASALVTTVNLPLA